MTSLELATWGLVAFTGLLTIATSFYAYYSYKMWKSSEENQKIVEEQNRIMSSHNDLLRKQTEALESQASAMHTQIEKLNLMANAITDLPFEVQDMKDRAEKSKSLKAK